MLMRGMGMGGREMEIRMGVDGRGIRMGVDGRGKGE